MAPCRLVQKGALPLSAFDFTFYSTHASVLLIFTSSRGSLGLMEASVFALASIAAGAERALVRSAAPFLWAGRGRQAAAIAPLERLDLGLVPRRRPVQYH